jgi:hypothetical protein
MQNRGLEKKRRKGMKGEVKNYRNPKHRNVKCRGFGLQE